MFEQIKSIKSKYSMTSCILALLTSFWYSRPPISLLLPQLYRVIADKSHIHMNATKWESLTTFVKYLGKQGLAIVDETEKVGGSRGVTL